MENLSTIAEQYSAVRANTESLCVPLEIDDYNLQAEVFTSPAKWHLAHTSWFFETFLLKPFVPGYAPFHPQFEVLFNSYYNGIGTPYPRPKRGLLSRPTVKDVYAYRRQIDEGMQRLFASTGAGNNVSIEARVALGLQHEMQHQELLLTDLKYCLAENPMLPVYVLAPQAKDGSEEALALCWQSIEGGVVEVGTQLGAEFCFDNETPRHSVYLNPFELSNRPVSNGEVLAFIADAGYVTPALWLSDGWATVQREGWRHPLYWYERDGEWFEFTLHGLLPLDLSATASHLSGYEADAIARWQGGRLPTEFEWEVAATRTVHDAKSGKKFGGHFSEQMPLHPQRATNETMMGSIWQWTSSGYAPYPGFQAAEGAIGEYNGKFMCNQLVLRGGSCLTSKLQARINYRNFFYLPDRWQCTGVRLARDRT